MPRRRLGRRATLLQLAVPLIAFVLPAQENGYVDSVACASCHGRIYEEFSKTPMGRSFFLPGTREVKEDWTHNNTFYHEPSKRHYEMVRRDGGFFVRRYQLDDNGRQIHLIEKQITHVMGSGERAFSYIHRSDDGRMIELPVSWYSQEQRWAMAPGYDRPNHKGFSRAITNKCMFCHNAYPFQIPSEDRPGWDHHPRFLGRLPLGIDCQRCHGPGAQHVSEAQEATSLVKIRASILNPTDLSHERQLEVCMQCHLETPFRSPQSYLRFGRTFYRFRPGEALGDHIVHFDYKPGTGHEDGFDIVSAAYRLRKSECFQKSGGELLCTTCHDPHRSIPDDDIPAHYRERCFTCHSTDDAKAHPMEAARFSESNCVECHMPPRRTDDVVHVAMTDHRIQRVKPKHDLLAPKRELRDEEHDYESLPVLYFPKGQLDRAVRDVFLGIAEAKEGADRAVAVRKLKRALAEAKVRSPEPYLELAEAQVKLGQLRDGRVSYGKTLELDPASIQAHNNLGNLLADMGHTREAIKHFEKAIDLDPLSADAYSNLGLALIDLGEHGKAEQAFRKGTQANPMYAEAHLNLGTALFGRGLYDEARQEFEATLVINPGKTKARSNLGFSLLALGQREEAAGHLLRVVREGDEELKKSARKALELIGIKIP